MFKEYFRLKEKSHQRSEGSHCRSNNLRYDVLNNFRAACSFRRDWYGRGIGVYLHMFDYCLRDCVDGRACELPVAVAPAIGHNFFFAHAVVLTMKVSWQTALGVVFVSELCLWLAIADFVLLRRLLLLTTRANPT